MEVKKAIKYAEKMSLADDSYFLEYNMGNKNVDVGVAYINGRFPNNGYTKNNVCQEAYYILEGTGSIFLEDKEYKMDVSDVIIIEKEQKYYVIGDQLKMVVCSTPAFYKEQQFIDNE